MKKKIPASRLKVGMYIHDLNCSWMDHPFLVSKFAITDASMIRKILAAGIPEVYINTRRGADVDDEAVPEGPSKDVSPDPIAPEAPIVLTASATPRNEVEHARALHGEACRLVSGAIRGVRSGEPIDVGQCSPLVEEILDSVLRKADAMLPLLQVKTRDEYTFQHCVAVSALAVAFGKALGMPREVLRDLAMGGLLHDVGKALVPEAVLNKPDKLTADEYEIMKRHASHGAEILGRTPGIGAIAIEAAAQHHERYDGSGYPSGLKGEQISTYGQVLAIVDVYDAITSLRVYHKGIPPTEALRRMFEWGESHFNPKLVHAFIKAVGIYPTGSLVRMESGRLGIVHEIAPDKLLQPVVKIFYDTGTRRYFPPELVDLSVAGDRIAAHESFDQWNIDQAAWLS